MQETKGIRRRLCALRHMPVLSDNLSFFSKSPFTISKETVTVHRELFSIKAFYIKHIWQHFFPITFANVTFQEHTGLHQHTLGKTILRLGDTSSSFSGPWFYFGWLLEIGLHVLMLRKHNKFNAYLIRFVCAALYSHFREFYRIKGGHFWRGVSGAGYFVGERSFHWCGLDC